MQAVRDAEQGKIASLVRANLKVIVSARQVQLVS